VSPSPRDREASVGALPSPRPAGCVEWWPHEKSPRWAHDAVGAKKHERSKTAAECSQDQRVEVRTVVLFIQNLEPRIGGLRVTFAVKKEVDEEICRQPIAWLQVGIATGQHRGNFRDRKSCVLPGTALREPERNHDNTARGKFASESLQNFNPPLSPRNEGVGPRRKIDHVELLTEREILEIACDETSLEIALAEIIARQRD